MFGNCPVVGDAPSCARPMPRKPLEQGDAVGARFTLREGAPPGEMPDFIAAPSEFEDRKCLSYPSKTAPAGRGYPDAEGVPHPCLRKLDARRPSAPGLLCRAEGLCGSCVPGTAAQLPTPQRTSPKKGARA